VFICIRYSADPVSGGHRGRGRGRGGRGPGWPNNDHGQSHQCGFLPFFAQFASFILYTVVCLSIADESERLFVFITCI